MHERLALARWLEEFPLSRLRDEARAFVLQRRRQRPQEYGDESAVERHIRLMLPKWEFVVGPEALAVNEQLRAEVLTAGHRPKRRIPTDVAVWAKGEPADRSVTKIGGLPYRPLGVPWPTGRGGESLRFVAQLCVVDSRDIIPRVPGDVLLIFGDDDALLAEPDRIVFEWWPLSTSPLVEQVPVVEEPLAPFFATLHRTEDWDDSIFDGTKIGGVPSYIQGEPQVAGTFLGSLGSISVSTDRRFPFVNVAEPRGWSHENDLMIGDMGSLYLFVTPEGAVQALSQCY